MSSCSKVLNAKLYSLPLQTDTSNFSLIKVDFNINATKCKKDIQENLNDMNDEFQRLETFKNWPTELSDVNTKLMALTGLYYTNFKDKVRCHFCELALSKWTPFDDIVATHLKNSPSCTLLRRRFTDNIPIDSNEVDRILPPENIDETGIYNYVEETSVKNDVTIKYPEFMYPQERLKSFENWPTALNQKPNDLSEAGFFYTGIGDKVLCFSCNVGLNEWDPDDIPIEEHARWSNKCDYIIKLKGESYIEAIRQKYENIDIIDKKRVDELETNDSTDIDKTCKICLDKVADTVFLPCGHIVSCGQCGYILTKCPMCRKGIENKHKVYYA